VRTYSLEDGFRISVNKRALCIGQGRCHDTVDPGVMAATDAPLELLKEMIRGRDDVSLSAISIHRKQVVLSRQHRGGQNVRKQSQGKGIPCATLLRVKHGLPLSCHEGSSMMNSRRTLPPSHFHSPQIPVISNTTMGALSVGPRRESAGS